MGPSLALARQEGEFASWKVLNLRSMEPMLYQLSYSAMGARELTRLAAR